MEEPLKESGFESLVALLRRFQKRSESYFGAGDRHSQALCRLQLMVYCFGGVLLGAEGLP